MTTTRNVPDDVRVAAIRYALDASGTPAGPDLTATDDLLTAVVANVYRGSQPDAALLVSEAVTDWVAELAELLYEGDADAVRRHVEGDGSTWVRSWRPDGIAELHRHHANEAIHRLAGGLSRMNNAKLDVVEDARRRGIDHAINRGERPVDLDASLDSLNASVADTIAATLANATVAALGTIVEVSHAIDVLHRGAAVPVIDITFDTGTVLRYELRELPR